jgi:hypothetical protein
MKTLKHIGRVDNTGAKVLVAFRTLPGESHMALVVAASNLPDSYHDSIMTLVESDQAQETFELGELLHIRMFPDGKPMLRTLQLGGWLHKVATDHITMTPTTNDSIPLDQLNVLIAEQRNCAVDDLAYFVTGAPPKEESVKTIAEVQPTAEPKSSTPTEPAVLTDKDIARSYRSQADAMYKEAARLRKQADELDPPQKKATKVKETADA